MNKRQEFVDWAQRQLGSGQSECVVAAQLKRMNSFYVWVYDHISTTHLDHVMDVEAWAIISAAKNAK